MEIAQTIVGLSNAVRIRPLASESAGVLVACAALWWAPLTMRGAAEAPQMPTVAVGVVNRTNLSREITVQAEFRPEQEIDLHAMVSGFLKEIRVDIGDEVKAGDVIATLEVPELKTELDRALAARQRAEADYKNAHLSYTRLMSVGAHQANLIAQQDIDAAETKDAVTAATLAAAKAEVEQNELLLSYTKITAPFDGVVTKRYADPGALIQKGTTSSTQSQPLIRLSEIKRLRLDFPISESYAQSIALGNAVEIKLDSSGETLHGTIARFSHKISTDTRTMETEVEVPNPSLKIIPGMYATVVVKTQERLNAITVPVDAVSGLKNPTVYLVTPDQRVEERAIKLGLETPSQYEVLSGLQPGDRVIVGHRSDVQIGEKVQAKVIAFSALP
jgi:RND family efflux transporter MFP subunit